MTDLRRIPLAIAAVISLAAAAAAACGNGIGLAPASPTAPPPTLVSLSPATGSSAGGASVVITGSGITAGAVISLGGAVVRVAFDHDGTIGLRTPPHPPGRVDVVVTNYDGLSASAAGAFTYVSPAALNPNRAWVADALDTSHRTLSYTIEKDAVVRATCHGLDEDIAVPLSASVPLVDGEFSIAGADGIVMMTGRIVSPNEMVGTMNLRPCTSMSWRTFGPRQP